MIEVLKKVIGRIEYMDLNSSEAQVKKSLIEPVIQALGWEIDDPEQCLVEYSLQHSQPGRVDYALCRGKDNPKVFIEAKKLGSANESGQDQLFRYAYGQGVHLLILTDGDIWNFYLTMAEGPPAERRFYRVNLSENKEKTGEYSRYFENYLGKSSVYSGEAIKAAETQHTSHRARDRAKKNIPQVWKAMLGDPDSRLRDILSQAVEDKCGTKPDSDDLDNFLMRQGANFNLPPSPKKPKREGVNSSAICDSIRTWYLQLDRTEYISVGVPLRIAWAAFTMWAAREGHHVSFGRKTFKNGLLAAGAAIDNEASGGVLMLRNVCLQDSDYSAISTD